MSWLENIQWKNFAASLSELWAAPSSNLGASLLFVAAIGILLLIFVMIGILTIYSLTAGDEDEDDYEYEDDEDDEEGAARPARPAAAPVAPAPVGAAEPEPAKAERFPRWVRGIVWMSFFVLALVALDVVAGGTDVCLSCHDKPHQRAKSDPHVAVKCVRCHEDRWGVAVLSSASARGMHIVSASIQPAWSGGYGAVTSRACQSCHRKQTRETLVIKDRQLKVSHAEPLSAGAICTDCHLLNSKGEVAERNRGMTPCLRCHDGKRVSNECSKCHQADPSAAIRDDETEMYFAPEALVLDWRCGGAEGCHKNQQKCDDCHGLRLPHSGEFRANKHAKYAAFEKKQSCIEVCHDDGSCGLCHEFHYDQRVSGHAPNWVVEHGAGRSMQSSCGCHAPNDNPTKPFCPICHD